jgi:glutathione synthase/RimK-type ligase-like ATP-grasp enzyme
MANAFRIAPAIVGASVVILRSRELGNNCRYIAENYPDQALSIVTPDQYNLMNPKPEWVIRWGTTGATVARETKVLNKASAIKETLDKASFRKKAVDAGLAPRMWLSKEELERYDGDVDDGVIVRPQHHARSEHLYHCTTPAELDAVINAINGPYYISEYIKKDRELRVFVVAGKAVIVLDKDPPRDRNNVSWGCVEEGALRVLKWSQWPMAAVENAIKAFNLSKLDFGAVDVMMKGEGANARAYFLEINTAPEVWKYYGERLGEAFHYSINTSREHIPTNQYNNWKDVAHPTLLA